MDDGPLLKGLSSFSTFNGSEIVHLEKYQRLRCAPTGVMVALGIQKSRRYAKASRDSSRIVHFPASWIQAFLSIIRWDFSCRTGAFAVVFLDHVREIVGGREPWWPEERRLRGRSGGHILYRTLQGKGIRARLTGRICHHHKRSRRRGCRHARRAFRKGDADLRSEVRSSTGIIIWEVLAEDGYSLGELGFDNLLVSTRLEFVSMPIFLLARCTDCSASTTTGMPRIALHTRTLRKIGPRTPYVSCVLGNRG